MSGGVALNSLANGKIQEKFNQNLFVYPAAGDAGSAVGACLSYSYKLKKLTRKIHCTNCYLGKEYSDIEIKEVLEEHCIYEYYEVQDELNNVVYNK